VKRLKLIFHYQICRLIVLEIKIIRNINIILRTFMRQIIASSAM